MAVRVVSDGPTETKRCVCRHCKYELEYVYPADTRTTSGRDIDGGGYTQWWVKCPRPECGKETCVKEI